MLGLSPLEVQSWLACASTDFPATRVMLHSVKTDISLHSDDNFSSFFTYCTFK